MTELELRGPGKEKKNQIVRYASFYVFTFGKRTVLGSSSVIGFQASYFLQGFCNM